jgi:hypothetical protein
MNSTTSAAPCEQIAQQIGSMFVCSPHDGFVKVRTPFLYPDGDIVDLFLRYQGTEVETIRLSSVHLTLSHAGRSRMSAKRS